MSQSPLQWTIDPPATEVAEPATSRRMAFEFRGKGSEYFRIWIVNLLLSILTLGIYSAWAKVRRMRYFYGNTFLDGHAFGYHAPATAILKGRLIVFAGYLAFFIGLQVYEPLILGWLPLAAIGLPWVLMRSRRFQLRMTSWRNVRFGFRGRYGAAMNAYVGWHIAAAVVLGIYILLDPKPTFMVVAAAVLAILYPFWVHKRVEYSLDNADFGREPFSFLAGSESFYVMCGVTAALSVGAYFGFFYAAFSIPGLIEYVPYQRPDVLYDLITDGPKGWALLLGGVIVAVAIAAMYRAWFLNISFGKVMVRLHELRSKVNVFALIWIKVSNLVLLLATLGLYHPFAKVRLIRYQMSCMYLEGSGNFGEFMAGEHADTGALGEEAGDFFNVDLGL
jgi:uncharacterized membrane protein YjgN (DUF898 family)